jgi:hypothetical protein
VNEKVFGTLATKTIEDLGWEEAVIHSDALVSTKRKGGLTANTEKITIEFKLGKITVRSRSAPNGVWDNGQNSKRVLLFIYAFQEVVKTYDKKGLAHLEELVEAEYNWDHYKIPNTLLKPFPRRKSRALIPIIGGLLSALFLGFLVALISTEMVYIPIIFEILVALGLGLVFKYLIRYGAYPNFKLMPYILGLTMVTTYFLNQFYQYIFLPSPDLGQPSGFFEFMHMKLSAGLHLDGKDLGSIGMIISWVLQLALTFIVGSIQVHRAVVSYFFDRVQPEVTDFIFYQMVKKKTEIEIRSALSERGWTDQKDQDEAFATVEIALVEDAAYRKHKLS